MLMQMLTQWLISFQQSEEFSMWVLISLLALIISILFGVISVLRAMHIARKYRRLNHNFQKAFIQKQNLADRIENLQDHFNTQEIDLLNLREQLRQLNIENTRLDVQLQEQIKRNDVRQEFSDINKQQLDEHFSTLAQKILEEKSSQVESQQNSNLQSSLKPFQEQLNSFQKKVEEIYDRDLRDRISLSGEIDHLKKLNLKISDDAIRLTQALRGQNKIQGNWGEMILEQVLEDSGLRKGHEYEVQVYKKNYEGKRLAPDVIVHLPNNKDVVIDSKVSLISYERYVSAKTDEERSSASKQFMLSMRAHVDSLNSKAYERLEGVRSLDFVFLFVPIEAAFLLALEHDTEIFRKAFNKQVVLVSPTTLFACLRTVEHLWRYEKQNQHAEEIARQAAGLHDKLVGFSDSLLNVGHSLEKASLIHETAVKQFSQGKGNVLDRVKKLSSLGVPTKKTFDPRIETHSGDTGFNDQAHYVLNETNDSDESMPRKRDKK